MTKLLGKEFVAQADEDKDTLNPVVRDNIDLRVPEDGEVVYRMRQLAKERNVAYEPSYDMRTALNNYLDRKGLGDPMDDGAGQPMMAAPVYNPGPPMNMPPPG